MTRILAALALLALASCQTPSGSFSSAPTPPVDGAPPPPPVVGHWTQDGSPYGETETLWIETDGSYTASTAGQSLLTLTSLSYLTSGTWKLTAPGLRLDDVRAGAHTFGATFAGDEMNLTGAAAWTFRRDTGEDAGAD